MDIDLWFRVKQAMTDLRRAFEATQDAAGGSFDMIDATRGMCLYYRTRGNFEIDQHGEDILMCVLGFVVDRWQEQGIVERVENSANRFRFLREPTSCASASLDDQA